MKRQGFSLVELLIVIAIIGILAAVALPQFQMYVGRAKISEAISLSTGGRVIMTDSYNDIGRMPTLTELKAAGSSTEGFWNTMNFYSYKSLLTYTKNSDSEAQFEFTLDKINPEINGTTLVFTYKDNGNVIALSCSEGSLVDKYRPKACRGAP